MPTNGSPQTVDAIAVTQARGDAAAAAGNAPSIHNTQPWRWRLTEDGLDLFLDRGRSLDITDPDSRLAILSCGAALHHACVSLAADGWHTTVARLPNPADPDHLATVRTDHRIPVEPEATRRLQCIAMRHTDRRPVLGASVDADKLRSIAAAVQSGGSLLHLLRADQVYELATAADHAQRTEAEEAAWQAELAFWTGGDRPLGTGIPDSAIPHVAPQTTVPGRDFGHHGDLPISEAHDNAAVFGILYGPEDQPFDWLRAGEALSAGWLTATELEVSVLPLSATIEVAVTREHLRRLLSGLGHPYLVLRFGALDLAADEPPHTPRLSPDQIVERA
jgi:nitroreductase